MCKWILEAVGHRLDTNQYGALKEQDAQLSQRDRAAGCVIVFAKSRTLGLGDNDLRTLYTVFQKKTSTHIIGYKLRNSCPILIIFDIKIPHII